MYGRVFAHFIGLVFVATGLRVQAAVPDLPTIVESPLPQLVPLDIPVTLSVTATGEGLLEYQWRLNGVNIPGASGASYVIDGLQAANAGMYDVIVRNEAGARLSQAAAVRAILEPLVFTDAFDARIIPPLPSSPFGQGQGSNAGATIERNEPEHVGKPGGRSVWYAWRAPGNGIVTFSTAGSDFDTLLAVYTATTLPPLATTTVAIDDDSGGFHTSKVMFNAEAGMVYNIAIDGLNGAAGNIVLSWQLETIADPLDRLPVLTRRPISVVSLPNASVNLDVDFVAVAGNQVRWMFKGQALPENGQVLSLPSVNRDHVGRYAAEVSRGTRAVLTETADVQINLRDGSLLRNLLAHDKYPESFRASKRRTTALQSPRRGGRRSSGGTSRGYTGTQIFNTQGASTETGEPLICSTSGGASEWYSYEAEANGTLKIDTDGSNFDTVLGVYVDNGTGTGFYDSLQEVACDNNSGLDAKDSAVIFQATAGTIYYVAVDGVNGAAGTVELHYFLGDPPTFSAQPASQSVSAGSDATFSASAAGMTPLSYQWRFGGANIAGATNATLTVTNCQPAQAGSYSVVTWNPVGTNTSAAASLVIRTPPSISTIGNTEIDEDSGTTTIPFTIADSDTPLSALTVNFSHDNDVLFPPGQLVLGGSEANRSISLTPAANASGSAKVTITVADDSSTVSASFVVTVKAVNDVPVANPATLLVQEEAPAADVVLSGTDVEGSALAYTIVTPPAKGVLSGTPPNLQFTPNLNAEGADAFTFSVNDGAADSLPATVTITITPVNDRPIANASALEATEDTRLAITLAAVDVEGAPLAYTITIPPTKGVLSGTAPNLTYTPNSNENGTDTFTFSASDGELESAAAVVTVTITPVNDAPIAFDQSVTATEDTPRAITLGGSDVEASALSYIVVSQPTKGVLSGSAPDLTYTPDANASGTDTFTFKISDGELESAPATITIEITRVNDPPTISSLTPIAVFVGSASEPVMFTIGDVETPLDSLGITSSSSEPTLLAGDSISITGSGTTRSLVVQAPSDRTGTATVKVRVEDGDGAVVTSDFVVTVTRRQVQVAPSSATWGGVASVPLRFEAEADEHQLSFSVGFDPAVLGAALVELSTSTTSGAALSVDTSQAAQGRLGIQIVLPDNTVFGPGNHEVAIVQFAVSASAGVTTSAIGVTDQPLNRSAQTPSGATVPVFSAGGSVALAQGFEADTMPRPDGNGTGSVTIADWVQVGRFVVGLDSVVTPGEFMRADCAPRLVNGELALGNGTLTVLDWVQAGRYAAGLDETVSAGGPSAVAALHNSIRPRARLGSGELARTVRVLSEPLVASGTNRVIVELAGSGEENAVGFSMVYDPSMLQFAGAQLPKGSGATLNLNSKRTGEGRLGCAVALPAGSAFDFGSVHLVELDFVVIDAARTQTQIAFSDLPVVREVASVAATALAAQFVGKELAVGATELRLSMPQFSGGRLVFEVSGQPGRRYAIEATGNWLGWQVLTNGTLSQPTQFRESLDPTPVVRWYRARYLP